MLAQGQTSSAKRGRLVADVSSGLIFLEKKNNTEYLSFWGWLYGGEVKFAFSTSVAQSFTDLDPGIDLAPLIRPC